MHAHHKTPSPKKSTPLSQTTLGAVSSRICASVFWLICLCIFSITTQSSAQWAGWTYARTESSVILNPYADIAASPGAQIAVYVQVYKQTWDVYTSDAEGYEGNANYSYSPVLDGTLSWEVVAGNGSFVEASSILPPGTYGTAATFQTGETPDRVRVTLHQEGVSDVVSAPLDIRYWAYARTESAMRVGLSANSSDGPGSQCQVFVNPYVETWEVYTTEQGDSKTENHSTVYEPVANGTLDWSVLSAEGSFIDPPSTLPSDGSGVSAMLQMGTISAQVQVMLHREGLEDVTESTILNFMDGSTSWSMLRTEGFLNVSLSGDHPSGSVPEGTWVNLSLHADRVSWEVWQNNMGTIQLRNYATSPASSAGFNLYSPSNSTSTLGITGGTLDGSGNATASYSMALDHGFLQADVSYDASTSGYATLEYTPVPNGGGGGGDPGNGGGGDPGNGGSGDPGNGGGGPGQNWQFDHVEGTLATQLTNDTSQGTNNLTTTVTYTSWEVWSDGMGYADIRNVSSSPAIGAYVNFEVIGGAGGFDNSTASVDYNGVAHTNFSFNGGSDATVRATAYFASTSASASLYLVSSNTGGGGGDPGTGGGGDPGTGGGGDPGTGGGGDPGTGGGGDPWVFAEDQSAIRVVVGSGECPTATVYYDTWELWMNSNTYVYERRNAAEGPAIGAVLSWAVTSGDASMISSVNTTDSEGNASACFAHGSQDAVVTVSATFANRSDSATTTVFGVYVEHTLTMQELQELETAYEQAYLNSPEYQAILSQDVSQGDWGDMSDTTTGDSGAPFQTQEEVQLPDNSLGLWTLLWEPDYFETSYETVYYNNTIVKEQLNWTPLPNLGGRNFGVRIMKTMSYDKHVRTGVYHYHAKITQPDGTTTNVYRSGGTTTITTMENIHFYVSSVQFAWAS